MMFSLQQYNIVDTIGSYPTACSSPIQMRKDDILDSTLNSIEPKFYLVKEQMYNSKGYKICGYMSVQMNPCQRIGKCPFHGSKEKQKIQEYPSNIVKLPSTKMIKKKPFRKGWTHEEHIRFLVGLRLYGRGSWKSISAVVKSRTPLQTQSHAQKYYQRQRQGTEKKKKSIHDQTVNDIDEKTVIELVMRHKSERLKRGNREGNGVFGNRIPLLKTPGTYGNNVLVLNNQYNNNNAFTNYSVPVYHNVMMNTRPVNYHPLTTVYYPQKPTVGSSHLQRFSNDVYEGDNVLNGKFLIHSTITPLSGQRKLAKKSGRTIPGFAQLTRMIGRNDTVVDGDVKQSLLVKRKRQEFEFDCSNLLPPLKKIKKC